MEDYSEQSETRACVIFAIEWHIPYETDLKQI